jgi:hypothetical protein
METFAVRIRFRLGLVTSVGIPFCAAVGRSRDRGVAAETLADVAELRTGCRRTGLRARSRQNEDEREKPEDAQ